MLGAELQGLVVDDLGVLEQVVRNALRGESVGGIAMLADNAQEGLFVDLVLGERAAVVAGDDGRLLVRLAVHDRGQGGGVVATLVGVIGEPAAHQQGAEVCVAQTERSELVRVFLDPRGRVARVIDQDLLRRQGELGGVPVGLWIELTVRVDELHQVEAGQVARGVIQKHVLGARVARVDAIRVGRGVPIVDGRVVLDARVTAYMGRLGHLAEDVAGLVGIHRRAIDHGVGGPLLVLLHGLHERIRDAHAVVGVLERDAAVGLTGEARVVAGLDQGPGLLLFVELGVDEVHDVRVAGVQDHHLGRAPGLAARLHDARERVVALHEADRPARGAAAGHLLAGASDGAQVRAGAGAELEEHGLRLGEVHDAAHRVLHGVDETGAALRPRLDADVEPDRRVEGHLLVDDEVGQLRLERLEVVVRREVALRLRPARDRVDDAIDELADAGLTLGGVEVAAEVFADHDVGGELAPERGDFHVLLLEDALAALRADAGGAVLPGDLVVGVDPGRRPAALERQAGDLALAIRGGAVKARSVGAGVAVRGPFGLRRAVHDGDRAAVGSSHLPLSS